MNDIVSAVWMLGVVVLIGVPLAVTYRALLSFRAFDYRKLVRRLVFCVVLLWTWAAIGLYVLTDDARWPAPSMVVLVSVVSTISMIAIYRFLRRLSHYYAKREVASDRTRSHQDRKDTQNTPGDRRSKGQSI